MYTLYYIPCKRIYAYPKHDYPILIFYIYNIGIYGILCVKLFFKKLTYVKGARRKLSKPGGFNLCGLAAQLSRGGDWATRAPGQHAVGQVHSSSHARENRSLWSVVLWPSTHAVWLRKGHGPVVGYGRQAGSYTQSSFYFYFHRIFAVLRIMWQCAHQDYKTQETLKK